MKKDDEFERKEKELRKARVDVAKQVFKKLPRNITLQEMKFAYIEYIMSLHDNNRTLAATELGINYTTIMGMIKRGEIVAKKQPKTGRPKENED